MSNKTRKIAVLISSAAFVCAAGVASANGLTEREIINEEGTAAAGNAVEEVCFGETRESLQTAVEARNDPEFTQMFFELACEDGLGSLLNL